MRLGDLNCWLTFDAPIGAIWSEQFTVKGSYWPLTAAEFISQLAVGGSVTGRVRIRYKPNVKILASWRIRTGNSILAIIGPPVNLGGRNEYYEIRVREVS